MTHALVLLAKKAVEEYDLWVHRQKVSIIGRTLFDGGMDSLRDGDVSQYGNQGNNVSRIDEIRINYS